MRCLILTHGRCETTSALLAISLAPCAAFAASLLDQYIYLNISPSDVADAQKEKRLKRGGFDQGTMLARTTTPDSLQREPGEANSDELTLEIDRATERVITHPSDLPAKPLYRRPDLRQVDEQPEKLFTFETEVNKLGDLRASLRFSLPIGPETNREFALTVELRRSAGALRGTIRIRLVPAQIPIDFTEGEP